MITRFFIFFFFFSLAASAQQLPMYSQYFVNDFSINPAVAGSKPYFPLQLNVRTQWASLGSIAPKTNTLSFHMPVAFKQLGVGAIVTQDKTGPYSQLMVIASIAYHLQLDEDNKTRLSFGLSGLINQHTLNFDELEFNNPDPEFEGGTYSKVIPDASMGAYLYSKHYFLSLSSHQLFESTFKESITSIFGDNTEVRHYFANMGYTFHIHSDFHVEPSVLVKATDSGPSQLDVNTRFIFNNSYWAGLSFRTSKSLVLVAGLELGSFLLSYSYDYGISSIASASSGSHEISVGFNINDARNRRHSYYW